MSHSAGIPILYITNLIGLILTLYDITLSIPREVDCIWKRRPSFVTSLYVVRRYGTPLQYILGLAVEFWISISVRVYDANSILLLMSSAGTTRRDNVLHCETQYMIPAFSSLRVWAISNKRWPPFVVVLVPSLVVPVINIVASNSQSRINRSHLLSFVSRGASIIVDILVVAITWIKTADIRKMANKANTKVSLPVMFPRDGTVYFLILLAMNIVCLVSDAVSLGQASDFGPTAIIDIQDAISSVLISHFILDLRSVYSSRGISNPTAMSSVRFATQAVGNLGAPLLETSTWFTSAMDNQPEESTHSEDPLSAGLIPGPDAPDKTEELVVKPSVSGR
ncbi:hypothetical protein NLI96_g4200 [Meripilus lineatus]|uniref:DUF6533 domain-containing protein n=1 Tax=Meripilus lineatus TaxID=2056292 RepID=A0AAD5V704_9APHY|nr:hypothetical protein NLI96_g4200 [Physisporinus lineatus]